MKKIGYPIVSTLCTIVFLYGLGNAFDIALLKITFFYHQSIDNGTTLDINMAILPMIIGVIVGIIVDHKATVK